MGVFSLFISSLIVVIFFSLGMTAWSTFKSYKVKQREQEIRLAEINSQQK